MDIRRRDIHSGSGRYEVQNMRNEQVIQHDWHIMQVHLEQQRQRSGMRTNIR